MDITTVEQARQALADVGFAEELVVEGDRLKAPNSATDHSPDDLVVTRVVRFRGLDTEAEEAVLFALSTADGQPLGTYAPSSHPTMSAADTAVVVRLHQEAVSAADVEAHNDHDHIAGIFDSRDAAQAAVEELRETGLGSDSLGAAVRAGASRAFERDPEVDIWHDTGVGMLTGAGVGLIGGMTIAAVTLLPMGVIGLGGVLALGATTGLGSAVLGGLLGEDMADHDFVEHEEIAARRLEPGQVLVTVCGHGHPSTVEAVIHRHGGKLLLRPSSS